MPSEQELKTCRICGYLDENYPWGPKGNCSSFEYCPCCGVQHGYQDGLIHAIRKYRKKWIDDGALWNVPEEKPDNWSLQESLAKIPKKYR